MGISIYVEDQVHQRTYAGAPASRSLARILDACSPESGELLGDIHPYGDTMLNAVQLQRFCRELESTVQNHADLVADVESLRGLAEAAVRQRGYLWFSGD